MAQSVTRYFDRAGTFSWLCPSDVTSVKVEAWGAGGGGGIIAGSGGGGGGGGAYALTNAVTVTPGTAYPIVVGAGGAADVAAAAGDSTFNTTTVVADGGTGVNGATGGAGGTTANSTGADAEAAGGAGSNGNTTGDIGGGGGGSAGPSGAGATPSNAAGGVGATGGQGNNGAGGAGGAGGNTTNGSPGTSNVLGGGGGGGGDDGLAGGNGGSPGAGGGGGETGGGIGADGQIKLTYSTSDIDVVYSDSNPDSGTATSTWAYTHPAGYTDTGLIVAVSAYDPGSSTDRVVTGITYNGDALTKLDSHNGVTLDANQEMWYLANPDTGTNNIVISMTGVTDNVDSAAASIINVHATQPDATNSDEVLLTATPSLSVTTVVDRSVVFGLCNSNVNNGTLPSGAGHSLIEQFAGTYSAFSMTPVKTPAGSVNLAYTNGTTDDFEIVLTSLQPPSVAAVAAAPMRSMMGMGT
jgi:hypothetical protein